MKKFLLWCLLYCSVTHLSAESLSTKSLKDIYGTNAQYYILSQHKILNTQDVGFLNLDIQEVGKKLFLRIQEKFLTRSAYIVDHHHHVDAYALWVDKQLESGKVTIKNQDDVLVMRSHNQFLHVMKNKDDVGILAHPIDIAYFFDYAKTQHMVNVIDPLNFLVRNINVSKPVLSSIVKDQRKLMTNYIRITGDMTIDLYYDIEQHHLIRMIRDFGDYKLEYHCKLC